MRGSLEAEYHATSYIVEAGDERIVLRIGEANRLLDQLLRDLDAGCYAFITAWNPGSIVCADDVNRQGNEELRSLIVAMGYMPLEGEGRGDDGAWGERSFFVAGMPLEDAMGLARRFGQHAIVYGRSGEPPRLVWCSATER